MTEGTETFPNPPETLIFPYFPKQMFVSNFIELGEKYLREKIEGETHTRGLGRSPEGRARECVSKS